MAIVLTAYSKGKFYSQFLETDSIGSLSNSRISDSTTTADYTYGSGDFEANVGIDVTGVLPSGGSVTFDLTSVTTTDPLFGSDVTTSMSGVRYITAINDSTTKGYDFSITATGANPLTDFFNGGSGNLLVKPYSFYSYNDPYGDLRTSPTAKNIQLNDISGSGAQYRVIAIGDLQ